MTITYSVHIIYITYEYINNPEFTPTRSLLTLSTQLQSHTASLCRWGSKATHERYARSNAIPTLYETEVDRSRTHTQSECERALTGETGPVGYATCAPSRAPRTFANAQCSYISPRRTRLAGGARARSSASSRQSAHMGDALSPCFSPPRQPKWNHRHSRGLRGFWQLPLHCQA